MISTDEARLHLRVDDPIEDSYIESLVQAATEIAVAHLNRPVFDTKEAMEAAIAVGSAPSHAIVINSAIRSAILLMVAHLYRNREAVMDSRVGSSAEMPLGVRYILGLYRWLPGV